MAEYQIFADYFQFNLEDKNANIDLSQSWTEQAITDLIAFDPKSRRGFGIGTARNMTVPVTVSVLAGPPTDLDPDIWDQINECSIEINSGSLVVVGNTYYPDAPRISVPPGIYRVRICYGGLNTISDDGLDGNDHYQITLWPAPYQEPHIIKHR